LLLGWSRSLSLRLRAYNWNPGDGQKYRNQLDGIPAAGTLHDLKGYQKFPRQWFAPAIQFP
jgi:hypothetical protein